MGNLKQICKFFGGLIKSHPKSAAILGSAGILYGGATINDTNVFDFGIKSAKKALRFNDDETVLNQVGRTVTDNFTTEGTYDSTKKDVKDFVSGFFGGGGSGEGSEAGQGGGLVSGLFNGIGNGIKNLMGGLMGGVTNMLSVVRCVCNVIADKWWPAADRGPSGFTSTFRRKRTAAFQ